MAQDTKKDGGDYFCYIQSETSTAVSSIIVNHHFVTGQKRFSNVSLQYLFYNIKLLSFQTTRGSPLYIFWTKQFSLAVNMWGEKT